MKDQTDEFAKLMCVQCLRCNDTGWLAYDLSINSVKRCPCDAWERQHWSSDEVMRAVGE